MRQVKDHADLEQLRAAGVGFIVNIREGHAKIHRVRCTYVEVMFTPKYPKFFSASAADVLHWLTPQPEGAWDHCGVCGGSSR
jgi:hypothetical protein